MNVQIITTPQGEEMVILPKNEFDNLIEYNEDMEDVATIELFKERLARGEEELIPSEVVNRILDGENKIRVWREHRGMSAKALAEAVGISPPYLSEIENGKKEGSVSTYKKIAEALKLTVDDLI